MTETITNEAYIAGALLIDGEYVIKAIRGIITRNDFHVEQYGAIFSASVSLEADGEAIDPVSIKGRAMREGVEIANDLIMWLMECVPTAAQCVEYAHRVSEDARKRRVKELVTQIQNDDVSTADELLATLQRETEAIRGSNYQRGLLAPKDTLQRFCDHVVSAGTGCSNFIPSGFPQLDQLLGGGFIRGGLYILGARPAMGKSTFAINIADNIDGNDLFVSLEMTPEQIMSKRVSRLTGLTSATLLRGDVTDDDWMNISNATVALHEKGVYINNRYDLNVQQIQLLAQSVPNLRAVIVDYLGLIQPVNRSSIYENVSQISRELKRMAITLNVPVICLCQLSRAAENREDKRPRLSDLRDSGSIEQDADAVLLLYRHDYYNGNPIPDGQPPMAELEIAKNRHGRTGRVVYAAYLNRSLFLEEP